MVEDADLPRAPTAEYWPGPGDDVPLACFVTAGCFSGAATIAQWSLHARNTVDTRAESNGSHSFGGKYRVDVPNFALGADDFVLATCSPKPEVVAYCPGPGLPVEFAFLRHDSAWQVTDEQPLQCTFAHNTGSSRADDPNLKAAADCFVEMGCRYTCASEPLVHESNTWKAENGSTHNFPHRRQRAIVRTRSSGRIRLKHLFDKWIVTGRRSK